ncbi:phosphomevalonate kinase [Ligilactobacillus cholophilus]|uniref:phosphomevalonate kinase n=1 Tax=Ligilactobacillus cholophilus TaxID=3050131 RepID=UPI0025B19503|nr:phosphomevalonate kinase [Ligilactobacillus cholophilus]
MINIKVPGKLYIAGEYAVVENGFPAVVTTINRFINLSIKESSEQHGTIFSKQYQDTPLSWIRDKNQVNLINHTDSLDYVLSAIHVTEKFLIENHIQLKNFDLVIDSQLDNGDGKKYGLGSSAAVTVGVVKVLCAFYNFKIDRLTLFKLAALAHYNIQGNGSLGDIAAIAYTGWIGYHSVNRDWLEKQNQKSLLPLIQQNWPDLKIETLTAPSDLKLLIGWTGIPASTSHLIKEVKAYHEANYQDFILKSKDCVSKLIEGFKKQNLALIQKEINTNHHLLNNLGKLSGVEIETPKLKRLIEIANNNGGSAKTSGAGGGDCGIAIFNKNDNYKNVIQEWKKNNIIPLQLSIYQEEILS